MFPRASHAQQALRYCHVRHHPAKNGESSPSLSLVLSVGMRGRWAGVHLHSSGLASAIGRTILLAAHATSPRPRPSHATSRRAFCRRHPRSSIPATSHPRVISTDSTPSLYPRSHTPMLLTLRIPAVCATISGRMHSRTTCAMFVHQYVGRIIRIAIYRRVWIYVSSRREYASKRLRMYDTAHQ